MFIVLWIFFIILNGKINVEIAVIGAITAAAAQVFAWKVLDWDMKKELHRVRCLPRVILYGFVLVKEIVKANFDVLKRIYGRKKPEPAIVKIPRRFREEWRTALLSNSITLTPGTITMRLSDDDITVHCLDKSLADGLTDSVFEKNIAKIGEEKK